MVKSTLVRGQLAVTLFCMGRYGNGASIQDIARTAGCSEGSVENYTDGWFTGIESLQEIFVQKLTRAEKEQEKQWIDEHLGFKGAWRDGWVMYDGTIVVLYRRPGLNGDAYYTRKANYGLNVQVNFCYKHQVFPPILILYQQIGNVPSNLRIIDIYHGHTGSCHDAGAFEFTAAHKFADWFFEDGEFGWVDSAYPCTP